MPSVSKKQRPPRRAIPSGIGDNSMRVEQVPLKRLTANPNSPRRFRDLDDNLAQRILAVRDFVPPLVVDENDVVIIGEIILRAARRLGWQTLPAIRVHDLSEAVDRRGKRTPVAG